MALGPFVISLPRLFLLIGLAAAWFAAWLSTRRGGQSMETPLWWSLLAGLIAARLGYVLTRLPDYAPRPWEALYLWQPGYEPLLGVMAALLTAGGFVLARRYPPQRLFPPLLVGLSVWGGLSGLKLALDRGLHQPLPDLTVADLSGGVVSLADFRGQPVVLNLWASWCPPCRREMPVLQAGQQARPDVHFVFLNQAESPETVRLYLASEDLTLSNVLLDPAGRMGRDFNSPGLPTTLFFDAEGRLRDTHLGEITRAGLGDALRRLGKR